MQSKIALGAFAVLALASYATHAPVAQKAYTLPADATWQKLDTVA
jgi:hypothetical protein